METRSPTSSRIAVPSVPALAAAARAAGWVTPDGEAQLLQPREAGWRTAQESPLVCHMPATARRLETEPFRAFDLLELFAFVRPATFCLPTPRGLAAALDLPAPRGPIAEAALLPEAADLLLHELSESPGRNRLAALAWIMASGGWNWGPAVLAALGAATEAPTPADRARALAVWERLPEWSEGAPPTPPGNRPIDPVDARRRLAQIVGGQAEPRPQQADYASAITAAFQPRPAPDTPLMVVAEAGTGIGKTLGYIAPASLWAEHNEAPVWLSTYTRNLQHQIDAELTRLFPDPAEKRKRVAIRKGRENYVCLLNYEDAARGVQLRPHDAIATGLMARWIEATRDGDLQGGDFPSWLADLCGNARTRGLADQRGECIFSACPHFRVCVIERNIRHARQADIVVANHALTMYQAALGGLDDAHVPTRYVFDEGHHLFDAADSAFSATLSGFEAAELRRWLLGAEGRRSRARGLKRRAEDLLPAEESAAELLDDLLHRATVLPGDGWQQRLIDGAPHGLAEAFLAAARTQIRARSPDANGPHGAETDTQPPLPELLVAAAELRKALAAMLEPLRALRKRIAARLDTEAEALDGQTRLRIEAVCRSLRRRAELPLEAWCGMLDSIAAPTPDAFVDWLALNRSDGRDTDVGMHRHWRDPMLPFAESLARPAHGLVVTSATLSDATGDVDADWQVAEARSGATHLPMPAVRAKLASPFDYARQTRVFIVTDVRKDDMDQVAAAYRTLFLAAGGGGLGLFTAIARLRGVRERIVGALEGAGLPLYAQHVDRFDTTTLIDVFRAETDSCLLGTDAVRDGVDVPGRSLRMIVFDRVPWARPDILHRARKATFGGRRYDDMIARLRLRQAFGRLVRRAGDRGVFVLLDPMMPSRLLGAFPDGMPVRRIGLADAAAACREFLAAGIAGDVAAGDMAAGDTMPPLPAPGQSGLA